MHDHWPRKSFDIICRFQEEAGFLIEKSSMKVNNNHQKAILLQDLINSINQFKFSNYKRKKKHF